MSLDTRRRHVRQLAADQNGSIAIKFAVVLVVVVVVGGLAIDFARASATRTDMQAAADGAILAAVQAQTNVGNLDDDALTNIARNYFNNKFAGRIKVSSFKLAPEGSGYKVAIAAELPTTLMALGGMKHLALNVGAMAEFPPRWLQKSRQARRVEKTRPSWIVIRP